MKALAIAVLLTALVTYGVSALTASATTSFGGQTVLRSAEYASATEFSSQKKKSNARAKKPKSKSGKGHLGHH